MIASGSPLAVADLLEERQDRSMPGWSTSVVARGSHRCRRRCRLDKQRAELTGRAAVLLDGGKSGKRLHVRRGIRKFGRGAPGGAWSWTSSIWCGCSWNIGEIN
ncbi:hypothetical protein D1007_20591 [Hordeum vulgare]|nr:hypothetical protein D1007_20591 [Hordeum vulgare]